MSRKKQIQAVITPRIKQGFSYFLKLSGNPGMKPQPGELEPKWREFLTKNNSNEKQ